MIFEIIPVKNGFIVQQSRSFPPRNPGAALSEDEVWVFPQLGEGVRVAGGGVQRK